MEPFTDQPDWTEMKIVIWILVAALIVAHQDSWNWSDDTLLFGFLPIGLGYHMLISIAAACVWFFACTFAWPKGVDEFDQEGFVEPVASEDKGGDA